MLHAIIRYGDGSVSTDPSPDAIRRGLNDKDAILWVALDQPTDDELKVLDEQFHFHALTLEDVREKSKSPKIEPYDGEDGRDNYTFIVFFGPDCGKAAEHVKSAEVNFFLSPRYLVTVHREKVKPIVDLAARVKKDPAKMLSRGTDVLLYEVLDGIVDEYTGILDSMQGRIDQLEDRATNHPVPGVLKQISIAKRDLLGLRRVMAPQREIIAKLARGEVETVRESVRVYLRDVQDHLTRDVETLEIYRDLILGARDIYLSSISNQLNQIMKTLTVITVIALPFTIITSFFGMNFEAIPGLHTKQGFWIACSAMLGTVIVLLFLFKRRRWI